MTEDPQPTQRSAYNDLRDSMPYSLSQNHPTFNGRQNEMAQRQASQCPPSKHHQNIMPRGRAPRAPQDAPIIHLQDSIPHRPVPQISQNPSTGYSYGNGSSVSAYSMPIMSGPSQQPTQNSSSRNGQVRTANEVAYRQPGYDHTAHRRPQNGMVQIQSYLDIVYEQPLSVKSHGQAQRDPQGQRYPQARHHTQAEVNNERRGGSRPQPVFDDLARRQILLRQQAQRAHQIESLQRHSRSSGALEQNHETRANEVKKKRTKKEENEDDTEAEYVRPKRRRLPVQPALITLCTGETLRLGEIARRARDPGFPAISVPIPADIVTEDIIREYPNHLWGSILLRVADFFGTKEIAEILRSVSTTGASIGADALKSRIRKARQTYCARN